MTGLGYSLFENNVKKLSENDLTGLCPLDVSESEKDREEACRNIEIQLNEWMKQPGSIDEDELQFPTSKSIHRTERLLKDYQQYRVQPRIYRPIRIVANGEGGISFRIIDKSKSISETFEIDFDGSIEYYCIKNGKMHTRKSID